MQDTVILVGCGNMGFAMLKGWLDNGILKAGDVHVVEPTDALRERAAGAGVHAYSSAEALPADLAAHDTGCRQAAGHERCSACL